MALTTYALLHAVWRGHMTVEDAAEALGIPVRNVKTQVKYLGDRLEGITQTLDDLTGRKYASRKELADAKKAAATKLDVTPRQVNRFLSRTGKKPRPDSILAREEASIGAVNRKREQRLLAIDVLYGRKTLTEAANLANRHERSLRRVLDELPVPVRFPDYDRLSPSTRYALAKNVEENRDSEHLAMLVSAQINRETPENLPKTVPKPLIMIMIAWLEGETEQYDPGFERFLDSYGLKGTELRYWERTALADELRNLL